MQYFGFALSFQHEFWLQCNALPCLPNRSLDCSAMLNALSSQHEFEFQCNNMPWFSDLSMDCNAILGLVSLSCCTILCLTFQIQVYCNALLFFVIPTRVWIVVQQFASLPNLSSDCSAMLCLVNQSSVCCAILCLVFQTRGWIAVHYFILSSQREFGLQRNAKALTSQHKFGLQHNTLPCLPNLRMNEDVEYVNFQYLTESFYLQLNQFAGCPPPV